MRNSLNRGLLSAKLKYKYHFALNSAPIHLRRFEFPLPGGERRGIHESEIGGGSALGSNFGHLAGCVYRNLYLYFFTSGERRTRRTPRPDLMSGDSGDKVCRGVALRLAR